MDSMTVEVYMDIVIQKLIFEKYRDKTDEIFNRAVTDMMSVFNNGDMEQEYSYSLKLDTDVSVPVLFDVIFKDGKPLFIISAERRDKVDYCPMISKIGEIEVKERTELLN